MEKKFNIIVAIVITVFLQNCETRTYEEISDNTPIVETIKYNVQVKPLLEANCISCHSASGYASFYPLTNYSQTKNAIDNVLDRIQRPNGDPEKMPAGGNLSATQIEIFKKWKSDGLLE